MKKVTIHKAVILGSDHESVDSAIIELTEDLPKTNEITNEELVALFKTDAKKIMEIFRTILPQGMRYQLLLLMLEDSKVYYTST